MEDPMRTRRTVALGASLLALLISACTTGGGTTSPSATTGASAGTSAEEKPTISVGSANFTEAIVVGEIYAQALEASGYTVERHLNIGARDAYLAALNRGEVDLVPEYLNSLLFEYNEAGTGDVDASYENLLTVLGEQDPPLVAYEPAPGQDFNAWTVTSETAGEHDLATMSDVAEVADELSWGFPPECATNPACGPGLKEVYGIDIATLDSIEVAPCSAQAVQRLNDGDEVQIVELCSTQAQIVQFNFVVLEDDKHLAAAENILPVTTAELAESAPADFETTLNEVSAKLTTQELTNLNAAVDVQHEDVEDVARQWLVDQGLV
jgi:osmoprotectant transport system substrate-binding protein